MNKKDYLKYIIPAKENDVRTLMGFLWEYLWYKTDMNLLTENWNFNALDIFDLLRREIEKLDKE